MTLKKEKIQSLKLDIINISDISLISILKSLKTPFYSIFTSLNIPTFN